MTRATEPALTLWLTGMGSKDLVFLLELCRTVKTMVPITNALLVFIVVVFCLSLKPEQL